MEKNEAIENILNRRPNYFISNGLFFLLLLVCAIFCLTWYIKVPAIIEMKIVLDSDNPPKLISSKISGRLLKKYHAENDYIKSGELIALMETLGDTAQIFDFRYKIIDLDRIITSDTLSKLDSLHIWNYSNLGELQIFYENLLKSKKELFYKFSNKSYKYERSLIENRLSNSVAIYNQLVEQKRIAESELKENSDSSLFIQILYKQKERSLIEFQQFESARLVKELRLQNINSMLAINKNEKSEIDNELLQFDKNINQLKNSFLFAYSSMKSAFIDWQNRYLIFSYYSGRLSFPEIINENDILKANIPFAYIIPEYFNIKAIANVSQKNHGKLMIGQKVKIKMDGYDYTNFGFLNGLIENIAQIPHDLKDDASQSSFQVIIDFPNELVTTYNKTINYKFHLTGSASVLVEDKRLFDQLVFDKLTGPRTN